LTTVNRMRTLPGASISTDEARTIVAYLVSRVGVDAATPQGERVVGKALVDARCAKCHDLQQVYGQVNTPDEWRSIVDRMKGYAPEGYFKDGETDEIARFLAETQTEESKKQTVASAATAPLPSELPAAPAGGPTGEAPSNTSLYLVLAVIGATFGGLALRRPRADTAATSTPTVGPAAAPAHSVASKRQPTKLTLARVESRTHDTKTFRFALPRGQQFRFAPGQFLTFDWIVDGRRVVRSYSICSSPTQTGYVEITVKRVPDGTVSVFLNDRAAVGLTVEAKGPNGAFVFDETSHRRVVLVAGGSGITPMMSILRTIDDRCLPVDATLVYAVRTPQDVIFGEELAALAARTRGFTLVVVPSKADASWRGPTGRISRELFEANVADPVSATFFLCGPAPFMDATREILRAIGVDDSRVFQEKFGGPPAASAPTGDASSTTVVGLARFERSGVSCDVPSGTPLLDVAEANGVEIPFSCRQGQCGTCATRLLSGDVTMKAEAGLDPESKAAGFVLVCVGHARGDVTLDA
jgi:glycine betaine catabolism B